MGKVKKPVQPQAPQSLQQRWNATKPLRPTRPADGFSKFVSDYSRESETSGPQLLRDAACAWRTLDEVGKAQYDCPDEMADYHLRMEQYRRVVKAMKRPGNAFALFVQNYWEKHPRCKPANKKEFGLLQKTIAKAWAKSHKKTKAAYQATAATLKELFRQEQEAVLERGQAFNVNWREGANIGAGNEGRPAG